MSAGQDIRIAAPCGAAISIYRRVEGKANPYAWFGREKKGGRKATSPRSRDMFRAFGATREMHRADGAVREMFPSLCSGNAICLPAVGVIIDQK